MTLLCICFPFHSLIYILMIFCHFDGQQVWIENHSAFWFHCFLLLLSFLCLDMSDPENWQNHCFLLVCQFGLWQPWELNPSLQSLTLLKWMKLFLPMALLEVSSLTTFGTWKLPIFLLLLHIHYPSLSFWSCYFPARALSVVWTTPLVATLGMSLTIPLAMLADMVIHGRHYSAIYILGSAQVIIKCLCVKFPWHHETG